MPTNSDAQKRELARTREVELTVTGRKSGRAISNPVWFVLERRSGSAGKTQQSLSPVQPHRLQFAPRPA